MKKGDAFQDFVADVTKVLQPGADVKPGVWVIGPDGRRDMDVRVMMTKDGKTRLSMIECKDWSDPVGIDVVDALVSKREDLEAESAAIYAKSGFTKDAIRKASRKGIRLAIPLKSENNELVRLQIWREIVAPSRSVDRWSTVLLPAQGVELPEVIHSTDILFQGRPLANWLHQKSRDILGHASFVGTARLQLEVALKSPQSFDLGGESFALVGFAAVMECSSRCFGQTVRETVSLGEFDVLRQRVTVPSGQTWFIGPFDENAWQETDCMETPPPLEPDSFQVGLTRLNPIAKIGDGAAPELEELIAEATVTQDR